MLDKKNLSPYANTIITDAGYLDILSIRPVPAAGDDVIYEITTPYSYRPDLLAYDLYGKRELWWVFAQRNMDVLQDPIFDFVPGTKIYIPKNSGLRTVLGV